MVKAAKEKSTLQAGSQRVGERWEPDISAEGEWALELQTESISE